MTLYPVKAKADPKKPYKLYAAIVGTFVGTMLTNEIISSNPWAMAIGGSVLAGIAVYLKGNPVVTVPFKREHDKTPHRETR